MIKKALTTEDIIRQLNTKIKVSLEDIKAALRDPTRNSEANIINMVDKAYREIISIIALLPKTSSATTVPAVVPAVPMGVPVVAPTPTAAEDGEVPSFWRKNRDYGER